MFQVRVLKEDPRHLHRPLGNRGDAGKTTGSLRWPFMPGGCTFSVSEEGPLCPSERLGQPHAGRHLARAELGGRGGAVFVTSAVSGSHPPDMR